VFLIGSRGIDYITYQWRGITNTYQWRGITNTYQWRGITNLRSSDSIITLYISIIDTYQIIFD